METIIETIDVFSKTQLEKKVDKLHNETRELLSELGFIEYEIKFLSNLLESYDFVPHLESMFEESQLLKKDLSIVNKENMKMIVNLHDHDNQLGGMLECNDNDCALDYVCEHNDLIKNINEYIGNYKNIKKRVFSYSNIILERKKKH